MSNTYRNRRRIINYSNKESMMEETFVNWRTGVPEPRFEESEWERYGRDKSYDGRRRKSYRRKTNEEIRSQTRRDVFRVMKNPEDAENMTFADQKNGKPFIWDFW